MNDGQVVGIVFTFLGIVSVIVVPIWLVLHYRYKTKLIGGINEKDSVVVDNLLTSLNTLVRRIETLEDVLDTKHPNWRDDNSKGDRDE